MHPPTWVVPKLEALHKNVRLAWGPEDLRDEGDKPKGTFFLIQLYHYKDAEQDIGEPWSARGPIFGSTFDPLVYVPIVVSPVSPKDVFSGAVIKALEYMLTPIEKRVYNQRLELGIALDDAVSDMAGQMGEEMYWRAQKSPWRPPISPKEDLTEKEKAVLRGEDKRDLKGTFMPSSRSKI